MRYWVWLAAKLVLVVLGTAGFWWAVSLLLPPAPTGLLANWPRFGSDLDYTFAVGFAVLVGFGLGWLCAVDQVYRCRRCARRLRMPVSEGNYSRTMLEGSPYTEYICTYGHGKLYVPDVHLSSSRAMHWIGYGSLWENLLHAEDEFPPSD
ncbi:MAG TPA: hypothetical protein VN690_09210 [Terriglobales bacterium]|nr:hypothetical protein [Terriglobales bacterium]